MERRIKRNWLVGAAAVAVTSVAIVGCGGTIASTSSGPGVGTAPTSAAAATATPNSLKGPAGTAFSDTDASGNVITITLNAIEDPAKGADQYTAPDTGKRFVAAKFTIVGKTGTFSDDANSDASLIGSDNQTYSPDFSNVAGCTNFNNGTYTVTPGQTSVGCVVFQVPNGVKPAEIEWNAIFSSGAPATWTIG
jgi:hypothetical protein